MGLCFVAHFCIALPLRLYATTISMCNTIHCNLLHLSCKVALTSKLSSSIYSKVHNLLDGDTTLDFKSIN